MKILLYQYEEFTNVTGINFRWLVVATLRHMPPENDSPVKVEGLAEDVAEGGFEAIGGANDIQVTYSLTVE